ncbi:ABC transporter permease [Mycolicibacterium sp. P9-64]|nr:ABC transporter permease [Mycolicibacterium sp. P9-64]
MSTIVTEQPTAGQEPRQRTADVAVRTPPSLPKTARWLGSHWVLMISVAIFAVALLWAVIPGAFTHYDPIAIDNGVKLRPPSAEHWFGTDLLGRDVYARIVYGARASLLGASIAVGVAVVIGSVLGATAGWFGGFGDTVLMRLIDVLLSIPGFLLAIAIVVLYTARTGHAGLVPAAIAVGLTTSATFARLIRSEVLRVRASNYVEAAITSGATTFTILRRHVIPNSMATTVSLIAVQLGIAVIWIASLSFLGLGAQPPEPEWGLLVSDGRKYIATRGWLTLFPALAIIAVVLATNNVSRHLSKRSAR